MSVVSMRRRCAWLVDAIAANGCMTISAPALAEPARNARRDNRGWKFMSFSLCEACGRNGQASVLVTCRRQATLVPCRGDAAMTGESERVKIGPVGQILDSRVMRS